MAIQLRRGTNAEWENTNQNIVAGEPAVALDSERFFVGTGAGTYAEYANVKSIASAYSTTRAYREGDYVMYNGKLYVCTTATTGGAWNAANWEETSLLDAMTGDIPYRNYETTSVSGDIASFDNGAGGIPVEDLEVEVAAVQDLHGYDNPWVGGAGKNLLDNTLCTPRENNGVTRIINSDGTITLNGTSTGGSLWWRASDTMNVSFKAGTYTPSVNVTGMTLRPTFRNAGEKNGTFTLTEDDVLINVRFTNTVGTVFNNTKVSSQIELGSTATAFEPYTNICPISGWDEVNVNVTGKNLVENIKTAFVSPGAMYAQYTEDIKGTVLVFNCVAGQSYTISGVNGNRLIYAIFDSMPSSNETSSYFENLSSGITFPKTITPQKTGVCVVAVANAQIDTSTAQIELGSTATAYESYNGQTYTTDLNGTRYGGSLDVTTGVLTLTHAEIDLGSIGWGTTTVGTNIPIFYSDAISDRKGGSKDLVCSNYRTIDGYRADLANNDFAIADYNGANARVAIRDSNYNNATTAEFKTAMDGVQLVYDLATPLTVQLTPTQVLTLLKNNAIWADSGKIINCTYRITNT